jgi:hypothetical protein
MTLGMLASDRALAPIYQPGFAARSILYAADHRGYCRALTARAMTSSEVINAAVAWTAISIFMRLLSGIVSVGLNALELVVDTYR